MNRDGHWNDDHRHDRDGLLESHPFPFGASPSERQRAIQLLSPADGFVARDRHVGNHWKVEIGHTANQIGIDGHEVPHQRRLEVRPQVATVWNRNHPVKEPGAAQMDQRKQRSGDQGERGDGLRAAGNRPPPLGLDDAQNRRDERACVADTNPEDERGDVEAPEGWPVLACHADAHRELEEPRDEHHACHRDQQSSARRSTSGLS